MDYDAVGGVYPAMCTPFHDDGSIDFRTLREDVRRLEAMIERFLDGRIWREVQAATPVYTEYPLSRQIPGGEFDEGEPQGDAAPVVQRGVIDLAYRKNGDWMLVDFKSDRVGGDPRNVLHGDHPYVKQVQTYAETWSSIFGEPAGEAGLWFADTGDYVSVLGGTR
jgi:ATP-dependent helicase/nuclease subunit A